MKRFLYFIGYMIGKTLAYIYIFYLACINGYNKAMGRKRISLYLNITPQIIKAIRKDSEKKLIEQHREN